MKTSTATQLLSIIALAFLSAAGAHADEADTSQFGIRFNSTRSAAEVATEAHMAPHITNGGTGFIGVTRSGVTPAAVRAQTLAALRAGTVPHGEAAAM
ncbi:DUF4148 domain-containing protein [Caenimonas terrae]|uniref:DUF4148 domain-containing protein n=1 Tax=Caenimonas terrae TaxID=696074 RepID=A0ABW0ND06_9BURK